jgi:hypothetical protein
MDDSWEGFRRMSNESPTVHPSRDGATVAPVEDAKSPFVKAGVEYWTMVKAARRFPARAELTLRGMAPFLPYSVIIGVIDDGADFEYRYVGDAQRQAFRSYFKGLRITQIEAVAPELGELLRSVYEPVRSNGVPFLVRGRLDQEADDARFRFHETAFLPLGASDTAVDHLLVVGVQVPAPFWQFTDEKLTILAQQAGVPAAAG